jgi:hypothetical protein
MIHLEVEGEGTSVTLENSWKFQHGDEELHHLETSLCEEWVVMGA